MEQRERVALVTGGGRGIGKAIALGLADDGADIAINYRKDDDAAAETVAEIEKLGRRAIAYSASIDDLSACEQMVAQVLRDFGAIDILVNNAGIAGPSMPVVDYPVDQWKKVIDIDLNGPFLCCKAVVPHMVKAKYGRIVNIASVAGKEGNPNAAAYAAAKGGLIAFTKALGKELAQSGVLVNCVTPAAAQTAILDQVTPEFAQYMLSKIPMGRFVKVEEIAALVCWLASEDCSFSTAGVFDISGGRATY